MMAQGILVLVPVTKVLCVRILVRIPPKNITFSEKIFKVDIKSLIIYATFITTRIFLFSFFLFPKSDTREV